MDPISKIQNLAYSGPRARSVGCHNNVAGSACDDVIVHGNCCASDDGCQASCYGPISGSWFDISKFITNTQILEPQEGFCLIR